MKEGSICGVLLARGTLKVYAQQLLKMGREETSWRVLGIDGMLIILKFVLEEWVLKCGLI